MPDTGLATQQGHILSKVTRKTKTTVGPASLLKLAHCLGHPLGFSAPLLVSHWACRGAVLEGQGSQAQEPQVSLEER